MAPEQTALAFLLLFGAAALEVYGRVCYVSQELDRTTKRYGWSLAEQRPCECAEFRLGGLNTKPQRKLHEVNSGEDNRVSVNEQGQIIQSPDCTEDQQGATFEETSRCARNNTYRTRGTMELQLPMTSPMRLEFTVKNMEIHVIVYFSPSGPGIHGALYNLALGNTYGNFYERESSSQQFAFVKGAAVSFIGVPVIMTYDSGRFELAVQGVQDSTLTCDVTSPAQPSWFDSFETYIEAEFIFTEPCINDFNPQFESY